MKLKKGIFISSLICSTAVIAVNPPIQTSKSIQALHLDWLNRSVTPGQDFYIWANGAWKKNNPIPSDYSSWGSFQIVNEKVQNIIHQMLIEAANNKKAVPGSIDQKVGDFFYSGMDEKNINQEGIKPLHSEFAKIDAINSLANLQQEIAHLHQIGAGVFFGFGSMQDFKNSNEMIGAAMQGGLGLPDRDYYLKDNDKFKKIREAYVKHVANVFKLLGDNAEKAASQAQVVMDIETKLAKASMSQIDQRDPHAVYHLMDRAQLDKITPNFSWPLYLRAIGLNHVKHINLAMPEFFKTLNELMTSVPLEQWKIYLRWHLADAFDSYLSKPFVAESFNMLKVLTGTEKILPRWKRVVHTENSALGFAIGKMYIEKHFSADSQQKVLEILKNIRAELRDDITTLKWMTPTTRKAALNKLDLMEERIGYPSKWWDYTKLKIDRGPYVLNVLRANEFLFHRDLQKIGKPIDRTEWGMTPQTINAYYDPSMNSLNIPAGILQTPFFDADAPAAVNYGSIGFVMGHEMTHGFDDQGAQFDGHGNLKNWWSPADLEKFKAATQCIVNQFSQYVVDGDLHVQGKLVVGEAAADLGGITLALRAFHRSKEYQNAAVINGMTPDQQFFLGTAHSWAMNMRPEQMRNQITVDPHPPAQYRVNGSLANIPQFQAAFGLPDSSPMVNHTRCVIW